MPMAHMPYGEWGLIWAFTGWWWTTTPILGATLVGYETAELVRVLSLMEAGATWQLLEQSVHIHPYGRHCRSTAADWKDMPTCPNM